MKQLKIMYEWSKDKKWSQLYTIYKEWLRQSTIGRVIDRFIRIAVITAVGVFLTNYTLGTEVLPLVQSSLIAGFTAAFDKFKNESLKKVRDKGYTRT